MKEFNIPIVIFTYKRPSHTQKLLDAIKKVNPKTIYIVADGPKNKKEAIKTQEVTSVVNSKKWASNIYIYISKKNLGLRRRVASGLDWVFENTDTAIILEDDLIPDKSFFYFCEEMLDKYKNNHQIVSIAGYNKKEKVSIKESYYFSKYVESWGWATWRRAWDLYDDKMQNWPQLKNTSWLSQQLNNPILVKYWKQIFNRVYSSKINSWAYRWMYSSFINSGLTIVPKSNLIEYHGYGEGATHTKYSRAVIPVGKLNFPITHPNKVS